MAFLTLLCVSEAVSYTHLDVYKRQILYSVVFALFNLVSVLPSRQYIINLVPSNILWQLPRLPSLGMIIINKVLATIMPFPFQNKIRSLLSHFYFQIKKTKYGKVHMRLVKVYMMMYITYYALHYVHEMDTYTDVNACSLYCIYVVFLCIILHTRYCYYYN